MTKVRTRRRPLVGAFAAAGLVAALLVGPAAALADAGGKASCVGLEASDISPPGSNGEFPAGAPGFVEEVEAIAAALGVPPGAVVSLYAKLHEGSHEDCDAAVGLG